MSPTTTATRAVATPRAAVRVPAFPGEAITAWGLAFALVLYLALRGGGYDVVVRDQIGLLVWWAAMLVAVAGLLPRLTRAGWAALALLGGWAAWTAIGIPGSESAERTLTEVGRMSTYAGVLVLALCVQGRAGSRHVLNGVACAVGVVTLLAVLSRFHPQWFPSNQQQQFLPEGVRRLSYPLNYWNALAGFMSMGAVLLLAVAATARTRMGQGLAAACVPLSGLGVYLAISRGGAIVLVVGLVAYMVLAWDRLAKLATLAVCGAGAVLLIVAADHREAVQTGLDTAAARSQGTEMIWLCLIVCAGTGALQVAIGLLTRHANRPRLLRVSRRTTTIVGAVALVAAVGVYFAAGIDHTAADKWADFKVPPEVSGLPSSETVFSRLQSSSGQGRYQFWQVAVDAYHASPVDGVGAGTFELWWARHATIGGSIIDAHSLYAQTLAELGWVGLALLLSLVALTVVGGAVRCARTTGQERTLIAGATAAAIVFWLQAAIEWTWQIAAMPVALLFLVAVIVGHREPELRPARLPVRGLAVLLAIAGFVPIVLGMSTTLQLRDSQDAAQRGNLVDALDSAKAADDLAGTSAAAMLQEALVLERMNRLPEARAAAARAISAEPTNWRPWLVRARLEVSLGQDGDALADFRTARRLNPRSPLFQ